MFVTKTMVTSESLSRSFAAAAMPSMSGSSMSMKTMSTPVLYPTRNDSASPYLTVRIFSPQDAAYLSIYPSSSAAALSSSSTITANSIFFPPIVVCPLIGIENYNIYRQSFKLLLPNPSLYLRNPSIFFSICRIFSQTVPAPRVALPFARTRPYVSPAASKVAELAAQTPLAARTTRPHPSRRDIKHEGY